MPLIAKCTPSNEKGEGDVRDLDKHQRGNHNNSLDNGLKAISYAVQLSYN